MSDWMARGEGGGDCCYEKRGKVRGETVWKKPFLTSLCVAACVWGAHPASAVVRRTQSRQPATSPSLPTNRHARLRLCAVLSVSAAEAGRRGTATAAPSIFPGMRRTRATPFSLLGCAMASLLHAIPSAPPPPHPTTRRCWLVSREGLLWRARLSLFFFF